MMKGLALVLLVAAPLAAGVRTAVRPAGDPPAAPVCSGDEVEQTRCEMAERRQVNATTGTRRSAPRAFPSTPRVHGPIAAGRATDWAQ